jgi:hypothetical protein
MALVVSNFNNAYTSKTDEYAIHALKVIDDGLLIYTKVKYNSNETFNATTGEGFAYGGLEDLEENVLADGTTNANSSIRGVNENVASYLNNKGKRNYDQIRFDKDKLTYYINADGFIVARYLENYTYPKNSNGQQENYRN